MADVSQVESVLVSALAQIVYPAGTANPSIIARPVRIYRGWPIPAHLDKDLKAGVVNVSVYPTDTEKRTTRYAPEWRTVGIVSPTLTLTPGGNTLTVGGAAQAGQNACAIVDGTAYIYPVQAQDTPASVATALATMAGGTSSGASITFPTPDVSGRVGTHGTAIREIRRQRRTFQVTFWCPDPATRDAVASAVDAALAEVDYLTLPDGSAGRMLYERSRVDDGSQKEGLYRRDLFYSVEYATTQSRETATVVATTLRLYANGTLTGPDALATDFGGMLLTESGDLLLLDLPRAASLQLESGAYMLLEDGSRLLLDLPVSHDASVQLETDGFLLSERGGRILLDPLTGEISLLSLESGGRLLTEMGIALRLDDTPTPPGFALLSEGGGRLLTEYDYSLSI